MQRTINTLMLLAFALLAVAAITSCQSTRATAPEIEPQRITRDPRPKGNATPREIHLCAGITLVGKRCTRRVKAEGDYCWQHEIQKNPCWRPKGSQPKEDCYYEDGDTTRPIPGKP